MCFLLCVHACMKHFDPGLVYRLFTLVFAGCLDEKTSNATEQEQILNQDFILRLQHRGAGDMNTDWNTLSETLRGNMLSKHKQAK